MNLLTGLFRAARKRLQTTDNDMGQFRTNLDALVAAKDTLGEEEVAAKVQELVELTNDLPDSDEKSKLLRFIQDFNSVKEQDAAVAQEAAKAVADLFEKLDTEAMKDSPDIAPAPAADPAAEEGADSGESAPAEEPAAEEPAAVEETDGACDEGQEEEPIEEEKEEVSDADPNAEYSLEEIYQFIKNRMAEDAAAEEESAAEEQPESIAEETAEEEVDEVTQDHALNFALPGNKAAPAEGTLAGMFATIKNGGR